MMKFLRVLGGWLIISGGAFAGAFVYSQGGGLDGWNSFRLQRAFEREPVFAIGCPMLILLGVAASNTGSRLAFLPALLLAVAAVVAAIKTLSNEGLIVAAVLTLAAAIVAAIGRRPVRTQAEPPDAAPQNHE